MLSPASVSCPWAWDNKNKTELIIHIVSPIFQTSGLSCGQQNSAQLSSSPGSLGLAPLHRTCAQLGLVILHHEVPMAAEPHLHSPALSWVWHSKLFYSQGTGRDGQLWRKDKIYNFPKREMEQNGALSRVHSLSNSPWSHVPSNQTFGVEWQPSQTHTAPGSSLHSEGKQNCAIVWFGFNRCCRIKWLHLIKSHFEGVISSLKERQIKLICLIMLATSILNIWKGLIFKNPCRRVCFNSF